MIGPNNDWIKNPTKTQVIQITVVWLLALFLLSSAITDFFEQTFWSAKFILIYVMMLGSARTVFLMYRNYFSKS